MGQSPVLFLDIDGVVSSHRNLMIGKEFDDVALSMLAHLQNEFNFLIVLSSSRRILYTELSQLTNELESNHGVTLRFHHRWKTQHQVEGSDVTLPTTNYGDRCAYWGRVMGVDVKDIESVRSCRGLEIQQWLNDEELETGERIDYVVVDDSVDLFPIDPKYYVRVYQGEIRGGLQLRHYDSISKKFNRIKRSRNKGRLAKTPCT